ncbi:MAG: sel1 repeat family protein [Gammaproteobacteria bacterium]|nr:sel1 repeat family protein [Gammaproteobacteria bacterium]
MRQKIEGAGSKLSSYFFSTVALFAGLSAVIAGIGIFSPVLAATTATTPKWLLEFETKCERGSMFDCQNAVHTYSLGKYKLNKVEKNEEKANYYLQRVLQMGEEGCNNNAKLEDCHLLGLMYFEGMAINRDTIKGMEIVSSSCEGGYEEACTWLHNKGVR